jgi:hypothetical protein
MAYVEPNNAALTAKASFINHNSILNAIMSGGKESTRKRKRKNASES